MKFEQKTEYVEMESFEKCSLQQWRPNHAKMQKKTIHQFQATLFKKKYNHKKGNKITFSHFMAIKVHQAARIFITYCDIWEDYILQCTAITTAQIITSPGPGLGL